MGVQKRPDPDMAPKWTDAEIDALYKGIEKYGTGKWSQILNDADYKDIFKNRKSDHLKDRYRRDRNQQAMAVVTATEVVPPDTGGDLLTAAELDERLGLLHNKTNDMSTKTVDEIVADIVECTEDVSRVVNAAESAAERSVKEAERVVNRFRRVMALLDRT